MINWFKKLFKIKAINAPIPTTLDEAVAQLEKSVTTEDRDLILGLDDMANFHFTTGRRLRNEWGLWSDGPLKSWFVARGVWHADDMSSIILDALLCKLRGIPFDFDAAVKEFKEYWSNHLVDISKKF